MPSTKKRARSSEGGGPSSTRRKRSNNNYQDPRSKKMRWRGPKDDPIWALQEAESWRRSTVYWPTNRKHPTASDRRLSTHAHRTAPAPVQSPRQHSSEPSVPHSPQSLSAGGEEYEQVVFNDSPISSDIPIATNSRLRESRALLRQTRHRENHTSAWKRRRDKQAMEWKSVAIPRIMPTYLANRAATESGRLPPPKPNHQCKCTKTVLKVELMTWDRKFS